MAEITCYILSLSKLLHLIGPACSLITYIKTTQILICSVNLHLAPRPFPHKFSVLAYVRISQRHCLFTFQRGTQQENPATKYAVTRRCFDMQRWAERKRLRAQCQARRALICSSDLRPWQF